MRKRVVRIALRAVMICVIIVSMVLLMLSAGEYTPGEVETLEITYSGEARVIHEGDQIELLTFNIGYAGLDQGVDSFRYGGDQNTPESRQTVEANLEGLDGLINSQTFDVLFLQEVDRNSKRSYRIDEEAHFLQTVAGSSAFAQDFRCLFVPFPMPDFVGEVNSGIQTITTLAVRSAQRIALPVSRSWPIRLWRMKHCILEVRIPIENSGRELVLFNLHMGEGTQKMEQEQLEALAERMEREYAQGNYVIAGGDFNQAFPDDNFSAYPLRHIEYFEPNVMERDVLGEDWQFVSDRSAPSVRLLNEPYSKARWWAQYYVLDGFILSPNVIPEQVKTVNAEFRHSDHNPVKLTVRLMDYSPSEVPESLQSTENQADE